MIVFWQVCKHYWREGATILVIVALLTLATCGVKRIIQSRQDAARVRYEQQIESLKKEAAGSKAIAQDALADNKLLQELLVEERRNREVAEKLFNDKTKTAQQKREEYEKIKASPIIPVNDESVDTDALCRRAAQLGISCE